MWLTPIVKTKTKLFQITSLFQGEFYKYFTLSVYSFYIIVFLFLFFLNFIYWDSDFKVTVQVHEAEFWANTMMHEKNLRCSFPSLDINISLKISIM